MANVIRSFHFDVLLSRAVSPLCPVSAQAATLAFFAHALVKPVYSYAPSTAFPCITSRGMEGRLLRQFFPSHQSTAETKRGAAWISRTFYAYRQMAARYMRAGRECRHTRGHAMLAAGALRSEQATTLGALMAGNRAPLDRLRWIARGKR